MECERSPRLNEMKNFFSETAGGHNGVPLKLPKADYRLFQGDSHLTAFMDTHCSHWGHFDPHYFASIPYRLEEDARLGDAMLHYCLSIAHERQPAHVYILGSAEGTFARTLAKMGDGGIRTLSCSPNEENEVGFYSHGIPPFASFFLGPFHHLNKEVFKSRPQISHFETGFDLLLEDTTFQMYSPNRLEQIEFVKRNLKDDGIMLFIEKFKHEDLQEYLRRERQKDFGYKARFFSLEDVKQKNNTILKKMNLNEVTISEMASSIERHFKYCYVTWNSGNFYTVISGNDDAKIKRLISFMSPPCIPNEYVYTTTPKSISKNYPNNLCFRSCGIDAQ